MKSWFPLTDYEFYAFLSSGAIVIVAFDVAFGGSALVARESWTITSAATWIVIAYFVGQLIAGPASSFLSQFVAQQFFKSPNDILLGMTAPRLREKFVRVIAGASEYSPFSPTFAALIVSKVEATLGSQLPDATTAYQIAFPKARASADTARRLDNFSNVYGMCRNVSFAALIGSVILASASVRRCDPLLAWYAAGALVFGFGMFGRFMKFYAAYAREVFRTFAAGTP